MNYWLQRAGMAVLLLLAVSMLTFGAMNVLGDPLFNILGPVSGAKDLQGTAQADGYALRTQGDIPSGSYTIVEGVDTLDHGEAVLVVTGDTLPKRADTIAGMDAVDETGTTITIVGGVVPGQFVQNGPEPSQLADVEAADFVSEEQFLADNRESLLANGHIEIPEITELVVDGDRATAKVHWHYDKTPDDVNVVDTIVVRENGEWKVCSS